MPGETQVVGEIARRFPDWAYKGISIILILLLSLATFFLLVGGFRVVILNQGLLLGANLGTVSFGPAISDAEL